MSKNILRICGLFCCALLCATARPARAQDPPPLLDVKPTGPGKPAESVTLGKIEFVGLSQRQPETLLATCGLAVGQSVTLDEIEAAAQRLTDSGWFKKLGYRLKGASEAVALTFSVEEETSANIPVVFDNFIWFADEDLAKLIRDNGVFGFDGTVPEGGKAPEVIAKILQTEIDKKRIKGKVEYETLVGEGGAAPRILYSVKGLRLPVCALAWPGAASVPEVLLQRAAVELLGQDYSRYAAQVVARYKLRPLFRQRGYWRAQFQPAVAQFVKDKDCPDGVRVTVAVNDGPQYVWGETIWAGNTAYQPAELDAALGLKTGALADESQLDKGLRALNQLYQRKGYLDLLVKVETLLADKEKRVVWRLTLTEGPQFKMGRLLVNGFPPAETQAIAKDFQLKTGAVFDAAYTTPFVNASVMPRLQQLGSVVQGYKVVAKQSPDKEKMTVDVTIELVKDEKPPPAQAKP